MRRCSVPALVAYFVTLLAGCGIYLDDDDPCENTYLDEPGIAVGQRNPETGVCEYLGGGPYPPCDSKCGPCVYPAGESGGSAMPSWGYCESQCTALDESTCLAASGCRAVYTTGDGGARRYADCW